MSDFNWDEYPEVNESKNAFNWDEYPVVEPEATAVDIAKRFGQNALGGFAQMGHGLINLPHNLVNLVSEEAAQHIPRQQEYDFAALLGQEKKEPVDLLTQGIFQYGPSLGIPAANLGRAGKAIESVPKVGKYLEKMLGLAAPQAAYTYAQELEQNPDEALRAAMTTGAITAPFGAMGQMARSASPGLRNAARALGAGAGLGLGYSVTEGLNLPAWAQIPLTFGAGFVGEKGFSPKSYAQKKVFEGITPEDIRPVAEAAERLGLSYITPAEAAGTQFAGQRQASLGRTPEASKLKYERGVERLASEEQSINRFFDDLYSGPQLTPQKEALYNKVMLQHIPEAFSKSLVQNDEIIMNAVKRLEGNPTYRQSLKDAPKNSFRYWDQTKKVLDDMQQVALRRGNKFEAKMIAESRDKLVKTMDSIEPDYPRARMLAQREITRRDLEKAFDKKEVTGRNFAKVIQSDAKFNRLRNSLSEFPELQSQLDDMRLVFPRLLDVPTARTAAALEATSMSKPRADIQAIEDLIAKTLGARADIEAVKLMTDPKSLKQFINESSSKKNNKLLAALIEHIGKASGQTAGASNE